MILIPSIDLRGGRCVRLLQGDFARETVYDLEPMTLVDRYVAAGAPWLHLVDLDGARDGTLANRRFILDLAAAQNIKVQVGGGIRSVEVVEDLLAGGVTRVVIGSAAVEQPASVTHWMNRHGAERICLALDVRLQNGTPMVQTRGWTQESALSLWQAVDIYLNAGLRHVLCTDVARDGAMQGPNIELYRECRQRYPQLSWQASGGVRGVADLEALRALGMYGAVSGKALLEGMLNASALRTWVSG
ncbi:MAG: 1-(5-phosphoribosyl)-5-[(5-phosphoribosylamino)methylideneamino]imidazole-4-carboxamide isomerase [Gammaproteobacteria bacterium]|nr:1-(5-phosphoribosyl)-5-[(5-phosphoribosylamino)methylideneamino]imidazole-4-carboxamide isomerase [Gammaproteobacteria bacterium]